MYNDFAGENYLINGSVRPISDLAKELLFENPVYEVVRMVDGVPLYMEDHIIRLVNSAQLLGFDLKEHLPSLFENVGALILNNSYENQNFKILVSEKDGKLNMLLYFMESSYPDASLYESGVQTVLFFTERKNPNAKALNLEYKARVKAILDESGAYEALLVNEKDFLTEGSRSNLFAVIEGCIYTPPSNSVLLGITRMKVLQLCRKLMIPVIETELHVDIVSEAEGLFLTGTSPKIMPIASVNGDLIPSTRCSIIRRLIAAYDAEIQSYVDSYKIV